MIFNADHTLTCTRNCNRIAETLLCAAHHKSSFIHVRTEWEGKGRHTELQEGGGGRQPLHLEVCPHNVKVALHKKPRDLHLNLLLLCDAARHSQRLQGARANSTSVSP